MGSLGPGIEEGERSVHLPGKRADAVNEVFLCLCPSKSVPAYFQKGLGWGYGLKL